MMDSFTEFGQNRRSLTLGGRAVLTWQGCNVSITTRGPHCCQAMPRMSGPVNWIVKIA